MLPQGKQIFFAAVFGNFGVTMVEPKAQGQADDPGAKKLVP
jgi:hypothetical protein